MKITEAAVRRTFSDGKLKAVVSVTFDDEFVVHDIKIVEGNAGLFLAMPSKRSPQGDYQDIAHPLNTEMRAALRDAVFDAYEKKLAEDADSEDRSTDR